MAATAPTGPTEPEVLAHAKRRLFADDAERSYAVVDTQFATDEWRPGRPIDNEVLDALAPFNHVRLGSGYPDLVGVAALDESVLAVERFGDDPPLVAVEAKGVTASGAGDVERAILQAYDRLHEANATYAAVPARAVSQTARTLARELNVGVLGVASDGSVDPVEVPRVVGTRTTGEADAIRFQASAQGVADQSFSLNHPKNYLAYPLALAHDRETATLLGEYVVDAVAGARSGARFLDLITDRAGPERLRPLGREVVRFARREYGAPGTTVAADCEAALAAYESWQGSPRRFCDLAPRWGQLARRIVFAYPATQLLVEELQRLHHDGEPEPTLPEFVAYCHELHPSFTVELFVRGTEDVRRRVLEADGSLRRDALTDGDVYHAPTVFQLKAMLFHAGILTERGAEPSRLEPDEDVWALRESVPRV